MGQTSRDAIHPFSDPMPISELRWHDISCRYDAGRTIREKTMMRISDIFKMLLKQRSSFLERQSSDTATRSRPKLSTYGMVMRFGVFSERDMLSIYVNETDCKMDCLSMLDYESVVFAFR
jgi:hypothetical protein